MPPNPTNGELLKQLAAQVSDLTEEIRDLQRDIAVLATRIDKPTLIERIPAWGLVLLVGMGILSIVALILRDTTILQGFAPILGKGTP
jgi:hypothetical protein